MDSFFIVHAWRIHDDSDQAGSAQDKLAIDVEESRFACFSVSVSYDGHYALAGANDGCIYLYDRHSDKLTLRVSDWLVERVILEKLNRIYFRSFFQVTSMKVSSSYLHENIVS